MCQTIKYFNLEIQLILALFVVKALTNKLRQNGENLLTKLLVNTLMNLIFIYTLIDTIIIEFG